MKNKEIEEDSKKILDLMKRASTEEKATVTIDNLACKIFLQYIDQLENKVKELGKGQHTLMQSRRKWKNKYYKEKRKNVK